MYSPVKLPTYTIKIISEGKPGVWYNNRIGEVFFNCLKTTHPEYDEVIVYKANEIAFIRAIHCEVVSKTTLSQYCV